jgi:hypothetical protein
MEWLPLQIDFASFNKQKNVSAYGLLQSNMEAIAHMDSGIQQSLICALPKPDQWYQSITTLFHT